MVRELDPRDTDNMTPYKYPCFHTVPFSKQGIQYAAEMLLSADDLTLWETMLDRFESLSHVEKVELIEKLLARYAGIGDAKG